MEGTIRETEELDSASVHENISDIPLNGVDPRMLVSVRTSDYGLPLVACRRFEPSAIKSGLMCCARSVAEVLFARWLALSGTVVIVVVVVVVKQNKKN